MVNAEFAARTSSIVRTLLMRKISKVRSSHEGGVTFNSPHFTFPVSSYALQEGRLPGKKFDKSHASEKFLKQLRSLICPFHGLSSCPKQELHDPALYWGKDDEDGKAGQSTRAKVGKQ